MNGRPLSDYEKAKLAPFVPQIDLNNARLIVGDMPWWLPKKDIGITIYNTIRLASYDVHSIEDIATLGHECTHVKQYRLGMNLAKYLWSCRHGYWSSPEEIEAYQVEAKIRESLK